MDSIRITETLPATPALIYATWLSSLGHSAMTGSEATCVPGVGGAFTAWEGYISGRNLDLEPGRRIVQAWRTIEFPQDAPDSMLVLDMAESPDGALITLEHSRIPSGQGAMYRDGWFEHYLEPMRAYFASLARKQPPRKKPARATPARRKAVRKKTIRKATRARKPAAKKRAPVKRRRPASKRKSPARRVIQKRRAGQKVRRKR